MKKQVKFPNALRTATLSAGLFLSASAFAQQVVVKGNVVDETGEPVIGASVKVVGGTLGTVTDIDGNFTLNADKKSTIEVTYIGYEPVKMQAGQNLTIHLKNSSSTLNEVVVIGYGAVKKSDLTGSVTALKPDSKNKGLVVNAQDMLAGKVAGVNVTSNSGEPGVGTQIRIRGGSSLNASNDPLIVIDGVPMDNNKVGNTGSNLLSTINPQDIESFNVLKDASATAIYGSRGSNGVIIITTKKGHKGQKPEVSYSGSVSLSMKKKTQDVMNGDEYRAYIKSLFNDPDAYAQLDVKEFTFENGPLGVLHAGVNFNKELEQIDIHAVADDGPEHQTLINGYVSPKRNYIDLGIDAQGTSMKFLENFCGSFMNQVEAWGDGHLNVVGDLKNINLVGDITAHGKVHLKQLNTDYTFDALHAHAIPDDILIENDTIFDRNRNIAILSGGIHHKHLTRLSYDLDIKAHNFLGFDTREFGDNTFYGTIYATGEVGIHGKSGETVIDINAEPEPGSIFVYNVASPDAISDKSFIHWHEIVPDIMDSLNGAPTTKQREDDIDFESDMRINFLVNTNQNLTLKLIMDEQSGDYITLNGDGVIRANYFNKGSFDMFGNYVVDHGTYKLTIQNLIKKEFEFMPGGTIAFGGNPYNAPLNLRAKYTVNGVPLSDLRIGRSFSGNNIRVDCLMDITGTPQSPKVDFSMDLPTVNSDAKQMIYSIINSQEEMNQQVLYLLGIGRFYAQTNNNQVSEDGEQQSQTSLAMQSLLSGTISQQLNTVLSNVVKSNNWNFGANISTGDEGFNNAEYEGILSGKLLNNRLLFNGQFGYRDNPNATQSFIGDFDLRYLIFPNGNLAIRMYNQTNDRYFTRNSLNTQGLGLIMKKDFNGLRDFFGIKKKKKKKK